MLKTKPWTGGTDEEYETQLFGFGAQGFKIAIRAMIEEKIRSGIKDMESSLQPCLGLSDNDEVTWPRACDKLVRVFCRKAGPYLEAIDEEFERLLKVPDNVVLPEDEVQLNQVTEAELEKLKNDVLELRKRVERGALLLSLLSAEDEEIALVKKVCEKAVKEMETLSVIHKDFENINYLKNIVSETQLLWESAPASVKDNLC